MLTSALSNLARPTAPTGTSAAACGGMWRWTEVHVYVVAVAVITHELQDVRMVTSSCRSVRGGLRMTGLTRAPEISSLSPARKPPPRGAFAILLSTY